MSLRGYKMIGMVKFEVATFGLKVRMREKAVGLSGARL